MHSGRKTLNHLGSSVCFVENHSTAAAGAAADTTHFKWRGKYVQHLNEKKRLRAKESKKKCEKSNINVIRIQAERKNSRKWNSSQSYCGQRDNSSKFLNDMNKRKKLHVIYS